jgi:hypothetical protein
MVTRYFVQDLPLLQQDHRRLRWKGKFCQSLLQLSLVSDLSVRVAKWYSSYTLDK